jgi:hypothetical protein
MFLVAVSLFLTPCLVVAVFSLKKANSTTSLSLFTLFIGFEFFHSNKIKQVVKLLVA